MVIQTNEGLLSMKPISYMEYSNSPSTIGLACFMSQGIVGFNVSISDKTITVVS